MHNQAELVEPALTADEGERLASLAETCARTVRWIGLTLRVGSYSNVDRVGFSLTLRDLRRAAKAAEPREVQQAAIPADWDEWALGESQRLVELLAKARPWQRTSVLHVALIEAMRRTAAAKGE